MGSRLMSEQADESAPELMRALQERMKRAPDRGARIGLAADVEFLASAARRRGDLYRAIALERDLEALQ